MTLYWRGQEAQLSVSGITVGVLQNIEIEKALTVEQLRGAGSILWHDLQATEVQFNLSAEVMSFDRADFATLTDCDHTGIDDSSTVTTYTIVGTFSASTGETQTLTLTDVYFENLPISGDKDSWVGLTLNGIARDMTHTSTA